MVLTLLNPPPALLIEEFDIVEVEVYSNRIAHVAGVKLKYLFLWGAQSIHNHSVSGAISAPGDTWPMWSAFEAQTAMVITIIPCRPSFNTIPCHVIVKSWVHVTPWYQENHPMLCERYEGYWTYHAMVGEGSYHGVAWLWYAIPFHLIASVFVFRNRPSKVRVPSPSP